MQVFLSLSLGGQPLIDGHGTSETKPSPLNYLTCVVSDGVRHVAIDTSATKRLGMVRAFCVLLPSVYCVHWT